MHIYILMPDFEGTMLSMTHSVALGSIVPER